MTPELSRPFAVARIGETTRVDVEADAVERDAVATRMGVHAVNALTCRFMLHRGAGQVIQALGSLAARVVQVCVVTLEPFEARIDEQSALRFVPAQSLPESEGVELDAETLEGPDEIPYTADMIDLGAALAEQLALALDPYPRKPGAALPAEVAGEGAGNAFSVLGRLRGVGEG